MRALKLGAAIVFGAMSASADARPDDCIKISNDLDRLACYDKALGRTPKSTKIATPVESPWSVQQETSKLTDQRTVIMSVRSNEQISCRWSRGNHVTLIVRCAEGRTVLYFNTQCHMTASQYDNYGEITYRLDSEKARTVKGDASTDNRALGLWSGARSIPVIKQMFGKSSLTVRMMPYGESPFTATFNISQLNEAIKPLRNACKW